MLTLIVYRHGTDMPDVCEFEDRADYLEAERTLRRIIRRRKERPVYGDPTLVINHSPTSGHGWGVPRHG